MTGEDGSADTLVLRQGDELDTDLLVIGTHFGGPGSGRVVSTDGGHRFVAAG